MSRIDTVWMKDEFDAFLDKLHKEIEKKKKARGKKRGPYRKAALPAKQELIEG